MPGWFANVERTRTFNGEFHLVQLVDRDVARQIDHAEGEKWRLHLSRDDRCQPCTRAFVPEHANLVLALIRRLKKRETLDVVPMRVTDQQRESYWALAKLFREVHPQKSDPAASINHDDLAISAHFHAGRVSTIPDGRWSGYRDEATHAP